MPSGRWSRSGGPRCAARRALSGRRTAGAVDRAVPVPLAAQDLGEEERGIEARVAVRQRDLRLDPVLRREKSSGSRATMTSPSVSWAVMPPSIGREAPQKLKPPFAAELGPDEIFHPGRRRAQDRKKDLRQGMHGTPPLARIAQRRKTIEDRARDFLRHRKAPEQEALPEANVAALRRVRPAEQRRSDRFG